MKKSTVILIVCICMAFAGIVCFCIGFSLGGSFQREELAANTHNITEEFQNVSIVASSTDVTIALSENGSCYAVCQENSKIKYSLTVNNGTLYIEEEDMRKWYDYVMIGTNVGDMTLYLPAGEYGALSCDMASGYIECAAKELVFASADFSSHSGRIKLACNVTEEISARTASGKIELSNCTPASLLLSSSSGNIRLNNVIVSGKIEIKNASGNIRLDSCDAAELKLKTSSGKVRATLLSDKLFETHSSSGKITCPPSSADGGKCSISTASGSIKIEVIK